MLKRTIVSLAVLLVGYQSCLAVPAVPPRTELPIPDALAPKPAAQPVSGEFGTVDDAGAFTVAREVPMVVGQAYGWRIKVEPPEGIVHWKEEFQLPAPPKTWGGNEPGDKLAPTDKDAQEVQQDGKLCVSEKDSSARSGYIFNFWSVASGDPAGKYEMRVYVEGKLFKTFDFVLVAPDPARQAKEKDATPSPPPRDIDKQEPANKSREID